MAINRLPSEFSILKSFAETTSDILFVLNPILEKVGYLNPAVKTILGSEETDLQQIQKDFLNYLPEPDCKKLLQTLLYSSQQGPESGELEIRIRNAKGTLPTYHLRYSPLDTKGKGSPTSFLCQCRNISSMKEYVKELQHSRLKLQMALDGSNMGVWSYDPKCRTFECDERTNQIFGVSPTELRREVNPYFLRIHPEDRALAIFTAFSTLRQKGRFNHEFRLIHPGSKLLRHVAFMGEFIHDEKSKTTKVTGVCTDITHHKLAENKLQTNETFLEESQRIAKIGCFDWNLELDKVKMTRQLFALLEIESEEEINLQQFYANIHSDYLPEVQKLLLDVLKDGKSFNHEFKYLGKGKEERCLWAQGKVVNRENKRAVRLIGSIQDITERKEKEKEIHTQNLLIRSMLNNLPCNT